ncbi:MAG: EAL domain-containing protein [Nitrospinota bacterium]|nr:EAL domain-containing protein [Nitrospinota bacterium]
MNQAKETNFIRKPAHSIEQIECENQWYASVFEFLKSIETTRPDHFRDVSLNPLYENTHRYLNQIISFRNAAFYLMDEQDNAFTLDYWQPASRESLFRRQIASLIKNGEFDWCGEPDRSYVYYDDKSGSSLIIQAIATPNHCFGVFAGMYRGNLLPDKSHEKLNRVSVVLGNLGQVMEGIFSRSRHFKPEDTVSPIVQSEPATIENKNTAFPNDEVYQQQGPHILSKQPFHDFVTELPSRALVEDRLKMALAHARYSGEKVAVLILDVDNFKRVNDFMGIPAGDMLLRNLSQRIRKCLREEDTLGRQGGDEFIMLLPDIHLIQDVEFRAQKILDGIRGSFQFEGQEIHSSCSVGIAVYPDDAEDTAELIQKAKSAMCQAKEEGKDRYKFFKPFMLSKGYRQMNLENSLRKAVDREEFQLHFQPKMSFQTGTIEGMEALLRWNHPEGGLIYPSEFVPVAEEIGLIQPIGEWVLLNACQQIKAWKRAGFPSVSIAVNLSGYQVNQPNFISKVQTILERTGVDPKSLEMEITETVLMDNSDVALSNLRQLDEMGIRISIDDFGTGYSSLSYLKRFPIHALKIDQSFVRGIGKLGQGTDAVITKAIVSLAQALNLRTVAEGVEHVQEKNYLESIGCDDMQGYLFSKPLPVEEINFMFTRNLENPVRNYWPSEGVPQTV